MSRRWIEANRNEFTRDVMRDFCMATKVLEEQFARFEETGAVSFATMSDLLGTMMNKGLLWRLKDTAHHLFRTGQDDHVTAKMLDWALGYIFHECIKLKEDAYQQQHYAPILRTLQQHEGYAEVRGLGDPLSEVLTQTRQSIEREVRRIEFILEQCRELICIYYARHGGNRLLARLLFDRNELVRAVFGPRYEALISSVYEDVPERMYILAAEGLMECGRPEEAHRAATEGVRLNPACTRAKRCLADAEAMLLTNSPRRVQNI
ncbi:hypothetical protein [Desulfovibrio psychrotolerans]|uniref:Uncharacterized protein n=1 Tax=Desulfovibrio psychrotolerans TaxID=415242 RepID=A0A7J0BT78_9BACT|nr:hypothetical protein [Desulfovibrio psychrotolerans]GFM36335.1 hypothetical protein DSM19430T_10190 [Desulfovibrio psychrotolerans]